jgi:peptide/nickel transport system substrate-binding protein
MKAKIILLMVICLTVTGWCRVYAGEELVIGKPFGPSVARPDPAKGYNGWYTSEAGITETLFFLDFEMNAQPYLVEKYRRIDSLIWEITLKKGIQFHDRSALNAEAVQWSLNRVIDPSSKVFNKRLQGLLNIKTITVRDDRTLVFKTHKPNVALLFNLTAPGTGIIAPSGGQDKIFGTGPFMLAKVVPSQEMVVLGFDGYWQGKPGFDKVRLKIIKNPATRMLAFEAGQLDVAVNFPEQDAARLHNRSGVKIFHQPTNRLCFLFVRVSDGPLADPLIRKAVNYALDRQEIVDAVLADLGGEVAASIFPARLPWCDQNLKPYPYDTKKADRLLAEAGASDRDGDGIMELNGSPLILNIWTYEGRAALKPTLELIQAQLKRVGIGSQMKITKKSSPVNQAMRRGEVNLALNMWNTVPQGDPNFFISEIFTRNAGSNFMGYHNAELDALALRGKITFDQDDREKIYNRIQEIIYADNPIIVLFHKSMVSAVRDDIENFRIHPAEKYLLTHRLVRK